MRRAGVETESKLKRGERERESRKGLTADKRDKNRELCIDLGIDKERKKKNTGGEKENGGIKKGKRRTGGGGGEERERERSSESMEESKKERERA